MKLDPATQFKRKAMKLHMWLEDTFGMIGNVVAVATKLSTHNTNMDSGRFQNVFNLGS